MSEDQEARIAALERRIEALETHIHAPVPKAPSPLIDGTWGAMIRDSSWRGQSPHQSSQGQSSE